MTLYKRKKMLNNRQSRLEFKLEFLKDSSIIPYPLDFIIHVSNSMLFIERLNESGTIFTYTNCSDGGMGRPAHHLELLE